MKKITAILILTAFAFQLCFAQDIYYTRNATLFLNGALDGKTVQLQTTELSVKLDYETADIIIKFPFSSLVTEIDSLQEMIKNTTTEVVFDGKLGLEYINTETHPPMKFTLEGWLNIGKEETLVEGEGELHHIGKANQYACMLGLTLHLDLEALGVKLPLNGMKQEFEAVITQALLQSDKN